MVPLIDIAPLIRGEDAIPVARALHDACIQSGFFYVQGHGIAEELQTQLESLSQAFFALPKEQKMQISMDQGGRAWRGFFPVGDELTSGIPDLKEGLYFGTELGPDDPRVKANLPMHGANLFPPQLAEMRATVLAYMDALTQLGQQLMRGISLSLGLAEDYFYRHFTTDPLCLFRVFHYPSFGEHQVESGQWGVGEHTDYGLLTILKQDAIGGLQVKTPTGWIDAPYLPNTFVCNIGDMLDRMTGGYYHSTPHRVRNLSGQSRYSYPFFFDPGFAAEIKSVPVEKAVGNAPERWDGADLQSVEGTYGDYLLNKVAKVFPDLHQDQL